MSWIVDEFIGVHGGSGTLVDQVVGDGGYNMLVMFRVKWMKRTSVAWYEVCGLIWTVIFLFESIALQSNRLRIADISMTDRLEQNAFCILIEHSSSNSHYSNVIDPP